LWGKFNCIEKKTREKDTEGNCTAPEFSENLRTGRKTENHTNSVIVNVIKSEGGGRERKQCRRTDIYATKLFCFQQVHSFLRGVFIQ
jgi:hypothetical protein